MSHIVCSLCYTVGVLKHWNIAEPVDPFIIGVLLADGYVITSTLAGGIEGSDLDLVTLVASRFGKQARPAHEGRRQPQWASQFSASWSRTGGSPRRDNLPWQELLDTGIMVPNKKYAGFGLDEIRSWPLQARLWLHAGFIEGDGHVREGHITISNHESARKYHEMFRDDLGGSSVATNNRGHVVTNVSRRAARQAFVSATRSLQPVSAKLRAAASFVDGYPLTKDELAEERRKKVAEMLAEGVDIRDVASRLRVSRKQVTLDVRHNEGFRRNRSIR